MFSALLYVSLAVSLHAQGLSQAQLFRGEVVGGESRGLFTGALSVEVYDTSTHLLVERAPVSPTGTFEFRYQGASPDFELKVVNQRGEVLRHDRLARSNSNVPLRLALPIRQPERPVSGIVSLRRLQHKPSRQARKEYDRAQRDLERRDIESAISHLRAATRLDPEFMEAYNNLGSRLLHLNRLNEAVDALERAAALDPAEPRPLVNLAIAQLHLGRHADAERTARAAAALPRDTRHAEYIVGLSLLAQKKALPESLALLERSCDEIPHAHVAAGQILISQGRLREAEVHLTRYLETNPAGQPRQMVESWLATLRAHKQQPVGN